VQSKWHLGSVSSLLRMRVSTPVDQQQLKMCMWIERMSSTLLGTCAFAGAVDAGMGQRGLLDGRAGHEGESPAAESSGRRRCLFLGAAVPGNLQLWNCVSSTRVAHFRRDADSTPKVSS